MLNLIPVPCLNLIFSFGTAREMGRVMSASKKCRAVVRKCNFAWYELYIRLYTKINKDHNNHECEYNLSCLKNPYKKTSCHYGRDYNMWITRIQQAASTPFYQFHGRPDPKFSKYDPKCNDYRLPIINRYARYDCVMYRAAVDEFYNSDAHLANYGNPEQLRQEFDELCKIMQRCVNPTHTKQPQYDENKNFRREFRIFFLNANKKVKFTKTSMLKLAKLQEEFEALQRKKRIAELVEDYE